MIFFCPHCGFQIKPPLADGLAACDSCERVFDTFNLNKILAASWLVRKWRLYDLHKIQEKCDLSEKELDIINECIVENDMTHDEFIKYLKENHD